MPNLPIIDFFQHPPYGVLTLEHLPTAPFTHGTYAINRPRAGQQVDAFGLLWSTSLVALGVGGTPGLVFEYEDRVCEIAVTHRFLDGTYVITQRVATNLDAGFILFEQLFPYSVDLIVGPPFGVDFFWILAF